MQDKNCPLSYMKFESIDQVSPVFFREKWHDFLGETINDSCSTGPGSKQCTYSNGVERVKVLLKALMYMILWFGYNVMDVVDVVMFYLVIVSDATDEFLPGNNKDLLN